MDWKSVHFCLAAAYESVTSLIVPVRRCAGMANARPMLPGSDAAAAAAAIDLRALRREGFVMSGLLDCSWGWDATPLARGNHCRGVQMRPWCANETVIER